MLFKACLVVICVIVLVKEISSTKWISKRVNVLEQKVKVLNADFSLWQLEFQDVKTNLSDLQPCSHEREKNFKSDKDGLTGKAEMTSERDNKKEAVLLAFKEEKKHRKQFEKVVLDKLVTQEKQQLALQGELDNLKSKIATLESQIASDVSGKRVDDIEATFTLSAVHGQLSELKTSLAKTDNKLLEVDKKHTKEMTDTKELWKIVNEKIESDLKGLSKQTDQMNEVLNGIVTQIALKISFSARLTRTIANLKKRETVVFDYAINNEGNAYSTTTGVFTAPIHGVYVFFAHIMGADRVMEMYMKKNDGGVAWLYPSGKNYGRDANMVVLNLVPGDRVYVAKHGLYGQPPFYVHPYWTSFSGFLLFPV